MRSSRASGWPACFSSARIWLCCGTRSAGLVGDRARSAPWRWMSGGAVSALLPGPQAAEDVGPGLPEDPSPELAAGACGQPQPHPVDSAVLPWGLLRVLCPPSPAASVCPEESGGLSAPARAPGPLPPRNKRASSAGPVLHEEPSGLLRVQAVPDAAQQ